MVLFAPDLSMPAKCLYSILLAFAWQEEECFPGQERLAEAAGCTDRTIRKYLEELKKYGLISWVQRGLNQTNIYYIHDLAQNERLKALNHKDRKERSDPDRKGFSEPDRKERSGQDRKKLSDKEYSVEEYSVNNNSCITLTGNTTGQSPAAAQHRELTMPSSKDLIAELTHEYRNTGATPRNGDFAFIGGLYRRYGYASVLDGISELDMAMAVEKIEKPLLYLKAILEGNSPRKAKNSSEKHKESNPDRESKKELIKTLYMS
ncbi:Helix-turn-helix domain-containing protein [Desulfoscipio geothermicus DSM 3669]|uniref:Helix-turn-helix domain-containing protein n=2 Tax=Desulfoscipio geothermicus TaxID=39060 RepID=A0A1I6E2A3_9FIRM|nr:Helix-turn-helix domain-containing protein [Desulfoscipio geothermicus DSM 3669]